MTRLEIGLLGPLVVKVNGVAIVPSAAKQRRLLALMAVSAGRDVGMSAIAEELWAGLPPAGPTAAVQTYVKQLRQRIAATTPPAPDIEPKGVLSRGHTGYRLGTDDTHVDARDFEAVVARAMRLIARGEDEEGARLLTGGLSRWRGRALEDVREGGILRAEALRLDELRLAALEARIAADLRLGRHAHVISELTALTCRHPLQELQGVDGATRHVEHGVGDAGHGQHVMAQLARLDAMAVHLRLVVATPEIQQVPRQQFHHVSGAVGAPEAPAEVALVDEPVARGAARGIRPRRRARRSPAPRTARPVPAAGVRPRVGPGVVGRAADGHRRGPMGTVGVAGTVVLSKRWAQQPIVVSVGR